MKIIGEKGKNYIVQLEKYDGWNPLKRLSINIENRLIKIFGKRLR